MANELETAVGSLLAVMLGDGGHRQAEVGTVQACSEATDRYYALIERADTAAFERDELRNVARDLCESVERWTGHGNYPEDSVLIGDIREAAGVLRDALDGRA